MDELTESLATSFVVGCFPNNPNAPHPRFAQYKLKKTCNQEERRRRLLSLQKECRFNYLSHVRQLAEGFRNGKYEDVKVDETTDEVPMDVAVSLKPPLSYKDQLMLSEWLVETPEDLETNWYLVLCPVGKRSLIVTSNGSTMSYTKSGYCVNRFPSHLPGGNRRQPRGNNFTVLDCIFSEIERTYYVLDIMCWNGHPVFDSETEFRFYWLNTKLDEVTMVGEHSSRNPYRFVALPCYPCSPAELERVMWSPLPFSQPLDGLLFYNRQTHYMHGPTPLVGWLKAYMMPEMLGIKVPETYLMERPAKYTDMNDHIKGTLPKKKTSNRSQPMQIEVNSGV